MSKINIYYGDRELILTDAINQDLGNAFNAVYENTNPNELKLFLNRFLENSTLKNAYIFGESIDALLTSVKDHFLYIEAAGGVVSNPYDEYLFIFRRGKWDLPKGKCEKGETIEETAVREVEEECGIHNLQILKMLPPSFHIYLERHRTILKKTWWFTMSAPQQNGTPQVEEDIVSIEWLKKDAFEKIKANTFPSILDVLKSV